MEKSQNISLMESPFTGGAATLKFEKRELEFRKDIFPINQYYYTCDDTGEEFTTGAIDQINVDQLYNQYREKYGIPFPDEIKQIREQYDLSLIKMSEILGFGVNSYRQYEHGDVPSVASGRLIRAAKDPEEFRKFLDDSKAILTEREYGRFSRRIDELIEKKRISVGEDWFYQQIFNHSKPSEYTGYRVPSLDRIAMVIAFFSENVTDLWKTKLNKLLFYADFLNYRSTGYSITGLAYRAIPFGPVPAEYDKLLVKLADDAMAKSVFVNFDNGTHGEKITSTLSFVSDSFTGHQMETLSIILKNFASLSATRIVEVSHREKAWLDNESKHQLISYQKYAFSLDAV